MIEWTDDDGRPLGEWVEVDREEWVAILEREGGFSALSVFTTLTDPGGQYGEPQVYTAWGRRGDDVPLVDICDYKDPVDGQTTSQTFRMFKIIERAEGGDEMEESERAEKMEVPHEADRGFAQDPIEAEPEQSGDTRHETNDDEAAEGDAEPA